MGTRGTYNLIYKVASPCIKPQKNKMAPKNLKYHKFTRLWLFVWVSAAAANLYYTVNPRSRLELPEVFLIGSFANFLVNTWNAKWTRLNKTISNRIDCVQLNVLSILLKSRGCRIFTLFVRIRKSYVWAANWMRIDQALSVVCFQTKLWCSLLVF